eukprot:scaffold45709_cov66-Phaeocystis_antarctica.AAC.5
MTSAEKPVSLRTSRWRSGRSRVCCSRASWCHVCAAAAGGRRSGRCAFAVGGRQPARVGAAASAAELAPHVPCKEGIACSSQTRDARAGRA